MADTSDKDYADLLARLAAVPAQEPEKRSLTHEQARVWAFEDLLCVNGEAAW